MAKIIIDFDVEDVEVNLKIKGCTIEQVIKAYGLLGLEIKEYTGVPADVALDKLIEIEKEK
jgi:hypothetical protein